MDRRLSLVTTMVADLVAREQKMTSADLTAIYKIVNQVMSPYDASSLKVSVIPVKASPVGCRPDKGLCVDDQSTVPQ